MSKPIGGARKSIKNQEGQGMLDIDENTSVEDDMFENVKTDEDMDHEMEEEEGGSAFEEEIDPDESDQQEQAVIPKSQTPFLSDKDTPESYGELIGFMEKFIEDQKAENDAFRKEVKDSLSSTATDFKQRTDLILDEMKSIQSDMKREASATRRAQNSLSKMVASFEQGDKYAETVTKAVTVQTNRYPTRVRLDRSSSYASSYASYRTVCCASKHHPDSFQKSSRRLRFRLHARKYTWQKDQGRYWSSYRTH